MNRWKVEEFFDEHPNPFNIEIFGFEGLKRIKVYTDITDKKQSGKFLFELTFKDWKKAQYYTRILLKTLNRHLDVFRIGKQLFLRKLLF